MNVSRAVPVLTVANLPAAVATYTSALGLDVLMDHGWIVTLGTPGQTAQFSLIEADETAPVNPVMSLQVDDLQTAYDDVVAQGFEIVYELATEDWGVRRFFFRDASGNIVNVLAHT